MMFLLREQREQVEALHAVLVAAGLDMEARLGLSHWVPPFPVDRLAEQARHGGVYGVYDGDVLVATFTVSKDALSEYPDVAFAPDGEPPLHLHRIAVHPEYQGRGVGSWCMAQIENLARESGCRSVRFDAFSRNLGLLDYYRDLGYLEQGRTIARGKLVVCFEKLIVG